ncbi:AarF/ABC1/UbiB kinase family protein [Candidatus Woesearchaeota archaeon]|nr:AarF/ABC1/UbiB kinase family protein [Candidatus Woesearchaeota archaeon]
MTLYELIKNHQHRQRLEEILSVFAEQEFGYLISKIKLHHHLPFTKRLRARIALEKKTDMPVRLRQAFEQLGPTFIKFGQLLSLRPDLVPPAYVAEFEKMQDHVPEFPFAQAQEIIEKECHQPLHKIFTSFSKTPIASASMAQVYKAKLGNKIVAVKVQRPNIKAIINTDIELMYKIADLLEYHIPDLKEYHLKSIVHEFERWTIKELNFRIEAHYAQKIARNFKGSAILKIPEVYPALSTDKVMVMEYIEGIPLHDIAQLQKNNINLKRIFRQGYEIFIKQFFIDGVFHADPHPGNILILKNGKIALIDFGIVGYFDRKLQEQTLDLVRAIVSTDYEAATAVILKMSSAEDVDRKAFEADIKQVFEQLQYTSVQDIQLSQTLRDLTTIINKHHLSIPLEFVLFEKTIITLEGTALRYQPEFNFLRETKTILDKLLDRAYFAAQAIHKTKHKLSEYKELLENFPETATEILEKARKFKVNIEIDDAEVRGLTQEIERSSGNLALGIIIAALIMGSATIMQISYTSYVPIMGFTLASMLSLWLIHRTIFKQIYLR